MSNNRHISKEELGYRLALYGKHMEVTETIEDYIIEKLAKIERLTDLIIDVQVRIEVQKMVHKVDIVMKFTHFKIYVHADTEEMYSAIDKAFDRLKRKLYNWKTRIQEYHARKPAFVDMPVNIYEGHEEDDYNEEIEAQNAEQMACELGAPRVVDQKTLPLKTLRTDEAVMKMVLSNDNFLVYKDEVSQELRVIYKRDEGGFGVIAPIA